MKKIAINGFGRIGRLIFRKIINDPDLEIVAINDLSDVQSLVHLLKYDSVHGKFKLPIEIKDKFIIIQNKKIEIFNEKDPENLPWRKKKIDCVLECTGIFKTKELAKKHINAGAKKVLISAPSNDADKTIVYSVNEKNTYK